LGARKGGSGTIPEPLGLVPSATHPTARASASTGPNLLNLSEMASEASDGELAFVSDVGVLACSDHEDNDLNLQVDAASDRAVD
jgi:hypothetical protein